MSARDPAALPPVAASAHPAHEGGIVGSVGAGPASRATSARMSTSTSVYLRFQFGFWCLLLPALHLPRWLTMELVTEYLVRDQALLLAFCAMGMAVSHACHLRLLGAQPERRVPWRRWPLTWALLTVGLLLPGAVTQFYNVGPLHVPGVGSTEAVLLFLVVRSSNASVVALGWAMGYAGIFAILRAHAAERARLQAQLALSGRRPWPAKRAWPRCRPASTRISCSTRSTASARSSSRIPRRRAVRSPICPI